MEPKDKTLNELTDVYINSQQACRTAEIAFHAAQVAYQEASEACKDAWQAIVNKTMLDIKG